MNIYIQKAHNSEAEEITQLARRAKASWGYSAAWLREWEPQLKLSSDYIDRHSVFVARIGNTLVGVIALEDSGEPEISHLWVAPESQGLGVGRRLVKQALEVAKSRGWSSLRIVSDPNAQRFYEGLGAAQVGDVAAPVGGTERVLPVLRLPVQMDLHDG
jgi:predicted N-acetyltransferase YhbS